MRLPRQVGLVSERVGFGPATMQTVVHDHVAVTTPSRPDHWPGNAMHLLGVPVDLAPWLDRFDRTLGQVPGLTRSVVAWETDGDAPEAEVPAGVELLSTQVGVIVPSADLPGRPVPEGVSLVRATEPRHWAGAKVLYLQTDWEGDEPYWRWHVDEQRRKAEAGEGTVVVAYLRGIPVGRGSLFVSAAGAPRLDQGVGVIEDVVVHPLYRGQGIASAVVSALVDVGRRLDPDLLLVVRSDPGSAEADWYARLGFVPTSRTWAAVARRAAG